MRPGAPTRPASRTGKTFERLWRAASAVGIRTKILGIVLALVALMGVSATIQVRAMLSDALGTQLKERGISVTRDLAARSTDLILVNDRYALHQLLRDTLINNPDVRYAFIVDPQGQVIAHTFNGGFPADLLGVNSASPTDHHHTLSLLTDEGPMWDTAVPIFDGRAGTARVGISDVSVHTSVGSATSQLLLTTMVVAAIGISAAMLLTWVLTRPILDLVRAAHSVGRADFTQRARRWADDEIGELSEAFNAMTAALAKADAERVEREQVRAQYVSGVIAAQEDERKRIARELHDSTSQSLTSLLIGLRSLTDRCDQPEIRQQVEDLRGVAGRTLDDVHSLALQLRPSVLDDLGLPAALERHIADYRRRSMLQVDLAINGLSDRRLPPDVETALYRITQESLTNITRHAQAQTASVLIECHDNKVRAIIEDDGVGFDPAIVSQADGHLGLYGIRERAELLGGSLIIESEPGRGASLFVEIPLALTEASHA
jgi:signal transduction histidine kinase